MLLPLVELGQVDAPLLNKLIRLRTSSSPVSASAFANCVFAMVVFASCHYNPTSKGGATKGSRARPSLVELLLELGEALFETQILHKVAPHWGRTRRDDAQNERCAACFCLLLLSCSYLLPLAAKLAEKQLGLCSLMFNALLGAELRAHSGVALQDNCPAGNPRWQVQSHAKPRKATFAPANCELVLRLSSGFAAFQALGFVACEGLGSLSSRIPCFDAASAVSALYVECWPVFASREVRLAGPTCSHLSSGVMK